MVRIFRRVFLTAGLLILLATCLLGLFRMRYNAAIRSLAQTQVRNATSDLINDAIDSQIEMGNIHYDRIVYFEKNLDGQIVAMKTNMAQVNMLKTAILNRINDEILALDGSQLEIPVGSLILPEFFSGMGPAFPVKIVAIRNSDGSFHSTFSAAGINQTLHQINMEVLVDVAVLVLGKTEEFTVQAQVVIAETVIVGHVPDTYFQNGG